MAYRCGGGPTASPARGKGDQWVIAGRKIEASGLDIGGKIIGPGTNLRWQRSASDGEGNAITVLHPTTCPQHTRSANACGVLESYRSRTIGRAYPHGRALRGSRRQRLYAAFIFFDYQRGGAAIRIILGSQPFPLHISYGQPCEGGFRSDADGLRSTGPAIGDGDEGRALTSLNTTC